MSGYMWNPTQKHGFYGEGCLKSKLFQAGLVTTMNKGSLDSAAPQTVPVSRLHEKCIKSML